MPPARHLLTVAIFQYGQHRLEGYHGFSTGDGASALPMSYMVLGVRRESNPLKSASQTDAAPFGFVHKQTARLELATFDLASRRSTS